MKWRFTVSVNDCDVIRDYVKSDHDCLRLFMRQFNDFFLAMKAKPYCVIGQQWTGEVKITLEILD